MRASTQRRPTVRATLSTWLLGRPYASAQRPTLALPVGRVSSFHLDLLFLTLGSKMATLPYDDWLPVALPLASLAAHNQPEHSDNNN